MMVAISFEIFLVALTLGVISGSDETGGNKKKRSEKNYSVTNSNSVRLCADDKSSLLGCEPSNLTYRDVKVCIPKSDYFSIVNNGEKEVIVSSISSNNLQLFHPVVATPLHIQPASSVVVEVVFFPYYVETAKCNLTIHSNIGDFLFQVFGHAVQNPHHLYPFTGLKLISGLSYQQPLLMFNPYPEMLYIREIYTTEDFLTLIGNTLGTPTQQALENNNRNNALPAGLPSGSELNLFQVGSLETTEVIKIMITANIPGAYHGYVHIRTDRGKSVVPVHVDVLEAGLQPTVALLDFGTLTTPDAVSTLQLRLVNNASVDVFVTEVVPLNPDPQLVVRLVDSPVVPAGRESVVAEVVHQSSHQGQISNVLLVVTNHSNPALATVEVPYKVTVLHGGVGFEHAMTYFFFPVRNSTLPPALSSAYDASFGHRARVLAGASNDGIGRRKIHFTNYFSVPVALKDISTNSCQGFLDVDNIFRSYTVMDEHFEEVYNDVIAAPLQRWPAVTVKFNTTRMVSLFREQLPFTCTLDVTTNISSHRIPLHILDGRVHVIGADAAFYTCGTFDESLGSELRNQWCGSTDSYRLHLGAISATRPRPIATHIANPNPLPVRLSVLNATHPVCICLEAIAKTPPSNPVMPEVTTDLPDEFRGQIGECLCHPAELMVYRSLNYSLQFRGGAKNVKEPHLSFVIPGLHSYAMSVQLDPLPVSLTNITVYLGTPFQVLVLHLDFEANDGDTRCRLSLDEARNGWMPKPQTSSIPSVLTTMKALEQDKVYLKLTCTSSHSIDLPVTSLAVNGGILPVDNIRTEVLSSFIHQSTIFNSTDIAVLEARIQYLNFTLPQPVWNNVIGGLTPLPATQKVPSVYKVKFLSLFSRLLFVDFPRDYDVLNRIIFRVDYLIGVNRPRAAYKRILELRALCGTLFPQKNYFPSFSVVVKSPVTFVVANTDAMRMTLPLDVMPGEYIVNIPVVREGMVALVYIMVFNPYDSPMEVKLAMLEDGETDGVTLVGGRINPELRDTYTELISSAIPLPPHPERTGPSVSFVNAIRNYSNPMDDPRWSFDDKTYDEDVQEEDRERPEEVDYETRCKDIDNIQPHEQAICKAFDQRTLVVQNMIANGLDPESFVRRPSLDEDWTPEYTVRGAMSHVVHRPVIPASRFNKLKSAVNAEGKLTLEQGSVGNPFVVRSLSQAVWVALPFQSVVVGPISYIPVPSSLHESSSNNNKNNVCIATREKPCITKNSRGNRLLGERHSTTLYISNNITGVDRVKVNAEWGTTYLEAHVYPCDKSAGVYLGEDPEKAKSKTAPIIRSSYPNATTMIFTGSTGRATGNGTIPVMTVGQLGRVLPVMLWNRGSLPLIIHDVLVDGRKCAELRESDRAKVAQCQEVPKQLQPGATWSLHTRFTADCALLVERRQVLIRAEAKAGDLIHIPSQSSSGARGWLRSLFSSSGFLEGEKGLVDVKVIVDVVASGIMIGTCVEDAARGTRLFLPGHEYGLQMEFTLLVALLLLGLVTCVRVVCQPSFCIWKGSKSPARIIGVDGKSIAVPRFPRPPPPPRMSSATAVKVQPPQLSAAAAQAQVTQNHAAKASGGVGQTVAVAGDLKKKSSSLRHNTNSSQSHPSQHPQHIYTRADLELSDLPTVGNNREPLALPPVPLPLHSTTIGMEAAKQVQTEKQKGVHRVGKEPQVIVRDAKEPKPSQDKGKARRKEVVPSSVPVAAEEKPVTVMTEEKVTVVAAAVVSEKEKVKPAAPKPLTVPATSPDGPLGLSPPAAASVGQAPQPSASSPSSPRDKDRPPVGRVSKPSPVMTTSPLLSGVAVAVGGGGVSPLSLSQPRPSSQPPQNVAPGYGKKVSPKTSPQVLPSQASPVLAVGSQRSSPSQPLSPALDPPFPLAASPSRPMVLPPVASPVMSVALPPAAGPAVGAVVEPFYPREEAPLWPQEEVKLDPSLRSVAGVPQFTVERPGAMPPRASSIESILRELRNTRTTSPALPFPPAEVDSTLYPFTQDDDKRGREQLLEDLSWAHNPVPMASPALGMGLGLGIDFSSPVSPDIRLGLGYGSGSLFSTSLFPDSNEDNDPYYRMPGSTSSFGYATTSASPSALNGSTALLSGQAVMVSEESDYDVQELQRLSFALGHGRPSATQAPPALVSRIGNGAVERRRPVSTHRLVNTLPIDPMAGAAFFDDLVGADDLEALEQL